MLSIEIIFIKKLFIIVPFSIMPFVPVVVLKLFNILYLFSFFCNTFGLYNGIHLSDNNTKNLFSLFEMLLKQI